MQLHRLYPWFDHEPLTTLGMGCWIDDQQDVVYYYGTVRVGSANVQFKEVFHDLVARIHSEWIQNPLCEHQGKCIFDWHIDCRMVQGSIIWQKIHLFYCKTESIENKVNLFSIQYR